MIPDELRDDWQEVNALIEAVLNDSARWLDADAIADCRDYLRNSEPVVAFDILAEELPERDPRLVEAARLLNIEY